MPYPDRHAYPDRSAYPDRFYPVVDSVAWVARLALLGVGTVQLRAKGLNDSEAVQTVSDALDLIRGTDTKLVVNDYWRAAIVAGAKHLHLGQEDLADADALMYRTLDTVDQAWKMYDEVDTESLQQTQNAASDRQPCSVEGGRGRRARNL